MRADLHFHSKYSDGSFWPDELVKMAKESNLEMIALTDHDTFEGVDEFISACSENHIKGVPAIEIDFADNTFGFKSELLGYFPDGSYVNTQLYLSGFQDLRMKTAELSLNKAKKLYDRHDLDIGELIGNKIGKNQPKSKYNRISLTKVDVFNYFNDKNIPHGFKDYDDFKNSFFRDPNFLELLKKPDFLKCIEVINKDGGYAVLAHPANQFNKETEQINKNKTEYLQKLKAARMNGLWGMEMHSYESEEEAGILNEAFIQFAKDSLLEITYGSDFHGENHGSTRRLGRVYGDFQGFKRLAKMQ